MFPERVDGMKVVGRKKAVGKQLFPPPREKCVFVMSGEINVKKSRFSALKKRSCACPHMPREFQEENLTGKSKRTNKQVLKFKNKAHCFSDVGRMWKVENTPIKAREHIQKRSLCGSVGGKT